MAVDVAVAVAGVIFVGHGQGHDDDDVYDHHSSLQLGGASFLERRLFLPPSATSLRLSRDQRSAAPELRRLLPIGVKRERLV